MLKFLCKQSMSVSRRRRRRNNKNTTTATKDETQKLNNVNTDETTTAGATDKISCIGGHGFFIVQFYSTDSLNDIE